MRHSLSFALLLLVGCATVKPRVAALAPRPDPMPKHQDQAPSTPREVARVLAQELAARRFDSASSRFEVKLAAKLPAQELGKQWDSMVEGFGALESVSVVEESARPEGGHVVHVVCTYEGGALPLNVTVDPELRVIGLRPRRPERDALEREAKHFLSLVQEGKWAEAVKPFDRKMAAALPADKLASFFQQLQAEKGRLKEIAAARVKPGAQGTLVDVECSFEKENLDLRVVLDNALRIVGFFVNPGWNAPPYASPQTFEEQNVVVGIAKYPLPGTLTLPRGKGPFPVVVLVHGSGPSDRDEAHGPNKTFKDLAWGLASRGIAVLRYVKKTAEYRGKLDDYLQTTKEEYLEDVAAAIDLLSTTPKIDPKRIFLVGHSLGAAIVPRVAHDDKRVAGIVLLAGPTRSDGQVHIDQHRYLMDHGWDVPPDERAAFLAEAENVARRLDSPDLRPDEVVEGIEGRYWLDLRTYQAGGVAPKLTIPIFVLQGERDYQVTLSDFEGWKRALAKKKNATFKLYPGQNHHFMPGKGPSTPQEYDQPNHVAKEVVDDIAAWVGLNGRR